MAPPLLWQLHNSAVYRGNANTAWIKVQIQSRVLPKVTVAELRDSVAHHCWPAGTRRRWRWTPGPSPKAPRSPWEARRAAESERCPPLPGCLSPGPAWLCDSCSASLGRSPEPLGDPNRPAVWSARGRSLLHLHPQTPKTKRWQWVGLKLFKFIIKSPISCQKLHQCFPAIICVSGMPTVNPKKVRAWTVINVNPSVMSQRVSYFSQVSDNIFRQKRLLCSAGVPDLSEGTT